MECTTASVTDPIKAFACNENNPAKNNPYVKFGLAAAATAVGLWIAGYFFTKGALAAGGGKNV